jgi:trans-aconitate methyltransferase
MLRFNQAASTYDDAAHLQQRTAQALLNHLPEAASNILDIGCGTGYYSALLAKKYPAATLTLLDAAPNALAIAAARLPQAITVCSLIEDYKPTTTFDVITANMALQWLQDPALIQRLQSWLSSNGALIFNVIASMPQWEALLPHPPPYVAMQQALPQWPHSVQEFPCMYQGWHGFIKNIQTIGAMGLDNKLPFTMRRRLLNHHEPINIVWRIGVVELFFGHLY